MAPIGGIGDGTARFIPGIRSMDITCLPPHHFILAVATFWDTIMDIIMAIGDIPTTTNMFTTVSIPITTITVPVAEPEPPLQEEGVAGLQKPLQIPMRPAPAEPHPEVVK